MVVGARQNFQFFRQNARFHKNIRALPIFLHGILHYLISITKLQKKSVHKTQLYISHASHLKRTSKEPLKRI